MNVIQAILKEKCPQCRKGKLFKNSPLSWGFDKMHKNCPECGLFFEVEPGFFIGAMYISYAMVVGLLLVTGLVLYHVFGDPHLMVYIVTVPLIVLFFLPFIFRYSRVLYLYMFSGITYKKQH